MQHMIFAAITEFTLADCFLLESLNTTFSFQGLVKLSLKHTSAQKKNPLCPVF